MQSAARLVLRPVLLARRAGVEAIATTPSTCVRALPGTFYGRRWFSSSPPSEDTLRKAERMVELMGQSTQLQQIMMNVLPGPLRNPDVFKQLFGDPAMRRQIAEIIAARGLSIPDHLLDRMSPAAMDDTFARASRLGLDPGQMFTKLMGHPGLLAKLQQPRILAAFLDISEDPSREIKYEGEKDLLEVVHKVREIMGTSKPRAAPAASAPAASTIELPPSPPSRSETEGVASVSGGVPPPPGQPPSGESAGVSGALDSIASNSRAAAMNPLIALMSTDREASKWLDNPQVVAAFEEVHRSPWKTVKYIFNRDVMAAFKDLKELMRKKKL
ncbi:hypothetical protein VOLCADRAFT_106004 [Volvox carteri f. nagariensis]|uniref:Uncharacterized protein n=1 Tax=Volvox carteri f. nagariensis TaxID=3068 RepID=D8U475_VOLCA|nr:uncharacterized protein VOLCADRAFT_106004 [Volvox carteri f. nagariensis]EFJ45541.1 hypothetical protein VOLCADRAFT_106004 [Volvox carteri f. nagariensis]|eukprot:XP_002953568.1 hypothetical protein VOLCADRAFT_106004 [Volvox carteri f. nagariensis]